MVKTMPVHDQPRLATPPAPGAAARSRPDPWRHGLPVFRSDACTLRELQLEDAPTLLAHLGAEEVSRFVAAPDSVATFERYITRAHADRQTGHYACFGVVPRGQQTAVGVFQLRPVEAGFLTAEWGFALGSAYWGTGLFVPCASQVLSFAFDTVGVQRLEARVAVINGRCNAAIRKMGAVREGVLRSSFRRNGQALDEVLWSILAEDWQYERTPRYQSIH